jgi:hypothetical protein
MNPLDSTSLEFRLPYAFTPAMPSGQHRVVSFFPKADAAVLQSKHQPPSERPTAVGPVFDEEHVTQAINPWSEEVKEAVYPQKEDVYGPSPIPPEPDTVPGRYLFPVLSRNERLRLTMLW